MSGIDGAFADASRLRALFVGENGYALAYGSHATTTTAGTSDLDLLFVGPAPHDRQLSRLVEAVVALHAEHGLRLDTEVAYEVKLHATTAEVDTALALGGFTIDAAGDLRVPPVVVASWFLNSVPFKLRLILNALTTQHVFLGGHLDLYRWHCATADRAVTLLALSLLDSTAAFTVADAVAALVTATDGARGEDFLGYAPGPALYSTVHRGLTQLIAEKAVSTADGVSFHQHHHQRRALMAALRRPPAGTVQHTWDNDRAEQGGCQLE